MQKNNNKIATFILATSLFPVSVSAAFMPVTIDGKTYYNDNYIPSANSQRILDNISEQEKASIQTEMQKRLINSSNLKEDTSILNKGINQIPVDPIRYAGPADPVIIRYAGPADPAVIRYGGPVNMP